MEHRVTLALDDHATLEWVDRLRQGFAQERPLLDAHVDTKKGLLLALMVIHADTLDEAVEEGQYAFNDAAAAAALPPADIVSFTVLAVTLDQGGIT